MLVATFTQSRITGSLILSSNKEQTSSTTHMQTGGEEHVPRSRSVPLVPQLVVTQKRARSIPDTATTKRRPDRTGLCWCEQK